ncbi:DNA-directed RNA polymerase III subunit RPC4-like isoform X2 [Harpegnathos saltator]|uniref:DNA-directed RNA polymerase III subunit RPC4 isoform X2 n=1 Tax=Harpegnathos saltator TaxID=610380 RepID=UPI00058C6D66|nr:DNA-directed RNA polymerase III subunit RPC4 isoform X2 [Harpegnathos saltator]XP_025161151.1 DNA-directed RNA polymerase III subunit RPC4-like isoform X2 [Harpegnathos saltator]
MNFSSDDAVNANNTLHKNIRVKIEPGLADPLEKETRRKCAVGGDRQRRDTSPDAARYSTPQCTSSVSADIILKNIKMEPGLPTTTQRLTSYRLPRDLTLGGNLKTDKQKKYTPNLNVQRNRKKDEPVTPKIESTKLRDSGFKDHGRGRGRGDRGRGKAHLIQSVGVWSEGLNAPIVSRRSGSSRDSSASTRKYMDKPKMNLNKVINKLEEEEKLKNLLGDDSADNDVNVDIDYIMLPLDTKKLYKKEIKTEVSARTDENDVDKKPIISENGEVVVSVKKEQKVKMEMLKEEKKDANEKIPEIIENKSNSYVLIKFPVCLPGLKSSDDKEDPKPKRSNDSRLTTNTNNKEKTEYCTIKDLNSGLIGKLELLKSGKMRLRLGENYLDVSAGVQTTCLQHVLAAKLDTMSLTGDLINLGTVKDTLVCSVSFESFLK